MGRDHMRRANYGCQYGDASKFRSFHGTDEQRNYYLPRLASGEEIPCFALTSPLAGSDAGSMPDTGIVCKGEFEGEEVLGLKLTWDKRYITLAPVATLLGLAFRAFDPDASRSRSDLGHGTRGSARRRPCDERRPVCRDRPRDARGAFAC